MIASSLLLNLSRVSNYSLGKWVYHIYLDLHIDSLSLVLVFCSISQPLEPSDLPANWTNTNIKALTLWHPWTQEIFHVTNNPQSLTVNANYLQESPYSPTSSLLPHEWWHLDILLLPRALCQPLKLKETHSHQYQIVTSICGTPRSAGTMPSNLGKNTFIVTKDWKKNSNPTPLKKERQQQRCLPLSSAW